MALTTSNKSLGLPGLTSILDRDVDDPKEFGPDFRGGFDVIEIVDGVEKTIADGFGFQLLGSFMPHVPFTFGGTQELKKDYYPGNSDPVVQVLGAREADVTIKGRLYAKRFKTANFREICMEFQRLIDAVRLRGNLLRLTMGDWQRYGYLEEVNFDLKRITDIDYSIKFSIVGFSPPKNCKIVDDIDDNLIAANQELINAAIVAQVDMKNYPDTMPRTLSEFLDDQISVVAEAVSLVTNFISGILNETEALTRSGNRALGLIKNAQSTISVTGRRIGAIQTNIATLGTGFATAPEQLKATIKNTVHFKKIARGKTGLISLQLSLAALAAKYKFFINTVPLKRHLVISGDSLQRLAMKYYSNADLWKNIYNHNKLTTTNLTVGSVLEIPRL